MNRYFIFLTYMVFLLCLTGCTKDGTYGENRTEVEESGVVQGFEYISDTEMTEINTIVTETEKDTATDIDLSTVELSLMQKVLLNQEGFYGKLSYLDENSIGWHRVEEYDNFCRYDENTSNYFYVIDLDGDSKDEICVGYGGLFLIFHEIDGKIYGYNWFYRSFSPLYVDATFDATSGASINSFHGNVAFSEMEFSFDVITRVETKYVDEIENRVTYYYKNGEPGEEGCIEITEEEYDEIMSKYSREEAVHYDFTIENILKYVE